MKNTLLLLLVCFLAISCTKEETKKEGKQSNEQENELKENEVKNPITGRIWLDKNLGAIRVAQASDDEDSYGDLYQWGRNSDGHEKRDSEITEEISESSNPGHGKFILGIDNYDFDWQKEDNRELWQVTNGENNPCPEGYRTPTKDEFIEEIETWSTISAEGAMNSVLKLPLAGTRTGQDVSGNGGDIGLVGISANYWISTLLDNEARWAQSLNFTASHSALIYAVGVNRRSAGASVRCIKD